MKRSKIPFLLIVPIFGLLLAALISAIYDPFSILGSPFDHPVGSDFLGVQAEQQLNAEMEYDVEWREKTKDLFQAVSRLSVNVTGPFEGLLKILVPVDVVVEAKDTLREETFENLHAFSIPLNLAPDEKKVLKFRYLRAPQSSAYLLRLLSNNQNIHYKIREQFPEHLELKSTQWKVKGNEISWDRTLKNAITLRLDWKRTNKPFKLREAKITALNALEITFNRNLAYATAKDGLNFSITDMNEKNSEITDRVFIEEAEVKDKRIFLTLRGMTLQRGESYKLIIKNIKDVNGNFIEPNPTVFTIQIPKDQTGL